MTVTRSLSCLAGVALAVLGHPTPAAAEEPSVISRSFPDAVGLADIELVAAPIVGQVRALGGPASILVDSADYSRAATLLARRPLLLEALDGRSVVVPPGTHALGWTLSGQGGPLQLLLRADDGFLLQVPLPSVATGPGGPRQLAVEEIQTGEPEVLGLVVRLPTVSATFGLRLAADATLVGTGAAPVAARREAEEPANPRRRSRADLIRQRLQERGGAARPERRDKQRRPRDGGK